MQDPTTTAASISHLSLRIQRLEERLDSLATNPKDPLIPPTRGPGSQPHTSDGSSEATHPGSVDDSILLSTAKITEQNQSVIIDKLTAERDAALHARDALAEKHELLHAQFQLIRLQLDSKNLALADALHERDLLLWRRDGCPGPPPPAITPLPITPPEDHPLSLSDPISSPEEAPPPNPSGDSPSLTLLDDLVNAIVGQNQRVWIPHEGWLQRDYIAGLIKPVLDKWNTSSTATYDPSLGSLPQQLRDTRAPGCSIP